MRKKTLDNINNLFLEYLLWITLFRKHFMRLPAKPIPSPSMTLHCDRSGVSWLKKLVKVDKTRSLFSSETFKSTTGLTALHRQRHW